MDFSNSSVALGMHAVPPGGRSPLTRVCRSVGVALLVRLGELSRTVIVVRSRCNDVFHEFANEAELREQEPAHHEVAEAKTRELILIAFLDSVTGHDRLPFVVVGCRVSKRMINGMGAMGTFDSALAYIR